MSQFFGGYFALLTLSLAPGSTTAQEQDALDWQPSWPGTSLAVVQGSLAREGPFVFRFRMPDGYWTHPHRHPCTAKIRVLSGTYLLGLGGVLDRAAAAALAPGSEITLKAEQAHFDGAEGETVIEVSGVGRWGVDFLDPGKDPARAEASRPLPPEAVAAIEAEIAALMAKWRIPGLSIAIVTGNHLSWENGYGLADLENRVPATAATVYRIASTTKPITAVAAMQLAEQGKLDLDAAIEQVVPAFPGKPWPITPRQLLGHLAGIRNYRPGEFGGQPENTVHYSSLSDALSLFKDDPLEHEPGTKYLYTTFGYVLLGTAIEGASGKSFLDTVRENIFEPANMLHTRADSPFDIIPNRGCGYTRLGVGEKFVGVPPTGEPRNCDLSDMSYKIPGGGLVSTVGDLARFAIGVQSGLLIRPETFQQMCSRQRTADGMETPYGLGWYVGEPESGAVYHGGVQKGVTSTLYLVPGKKLAVAILTNLEGGGMLGLEALAERIAALLAK